MADAPNMRTVRVDLPGSPYDVRIGPGTLAALGTITRDRLGEDATRAFVVADSNLPDATIEAAVCALESAGFQVPMARAFASEQEKSIATAERLLTEVERAGLSRWDAVIALGGGIVGDVAGFVGATYRRGVRVVQCPTTLLAMVDASVGGKTGVNLDIDGTLRKNIVGSFWQPEAVIADTDTLASLDPRVLRAGLGECLKHGLLCADTDPELWNWTISSFESVIRLDQSALVELVARNVAVKAGVVIGDEREQSADGPGRAALNLGHTFAHAIETIPHLSPTNMQGASPLMHGEAVLYGLIAASAVSESLGSIDPGATDRIRKTITHLGLEPRLDGLPDNDELFERMTSDKKVRSGLLRLVIPRRDGRVELVTANDSSVVSSGWDAIRTA